MAMKFRYGRLAGVIAIVGLLLIGFLLILSGGPKKPSTPVNTPKPLIDYIDSNARVIATVKGAVNAQERHREIRVSIGPNSRKIEIIRGYNNEVIKNKNYPNSRAAFSELLYALSYAEFTRERESDIKSEHGICSLGNRYVFELKEGRRSITRFWTSTCSGVGRGTFGGNTPHVLTLFEDQIPDYDDLTQRVNLR